MRSVGIVALGALLCLSVPAKAELLVNISKSQQRLSVTIDGKEAYRWPVSTGRRGHATPTGSFHPVRLERHWYSHEYGMTPMPWSVFFHRGYAVHGTMEADNLGHAASHGCIRLRPDNASILFSLVRHQGIRNTKIVVMNGPLPHAPGAMPLADADALPAQTVAEQHFAKILEARILEDEDKASENVEEQRGLSARTHANAGSRREEEKQPIVHYDVMRVGTAVIYHLSAANGEARVLREREAGLRGLDRKYGFAW